MNFFKRLFGIKDNPTNKEEEDKPTAENQESSEEAGFYIIVYDNYHYMDTSEAFRAGSFRTYEEALEKAKERVAYCLEENFDESDNAAHFLSLYKRFGEDPVIKNDDPNTRFQSFSAWSYAEEIAPELFKKLTVKKEGKDKPTLEEIHRGFDPSEFDEVCEYSSRSESFGNHHVSLVRKGKKWGVFNHDKNKMTIDCFFDKIEPLKMTRAEREKPLVYLARKGDEWGCINDNDHIVAPFDVRSELNFDYFLESDILVFSKGSKFGIVNKFTGEEMHPFVFDQCLIFGDLLRVKQGNKYGGFDKDGEKVIPIVHKVLEPISKYSEYIGSYIDSFTAMKDEKWGVLSTDGYERAPCVYDYDWAAEQYAGIGRAEIVEEGVVKGYNEVYLNNYKGVPDWLQYAGLFCESDPSKYDNDEIEELSEYESHYYYKIYLRLRGKSTHLLYAYTSTYDASYDPYHFDREDGFIVDLHLDGDAVIISANPTDRGPRQLVSYDKGETWEDISSIPDSKPILTLQVER